MTFGSVKTRSGLEPVVGYEPSTYNPYADDDSYCAIEIGSHTV